MRELRLYLRRDSLRGNDDCSWVLRANNGAIVASGNTLGDLPAADTCHLVLAGDLVSVVPASLPDLSERKLSPLLPSAAEAHALGEAEELHACQLERNSSGTAWLAVIDREWLAYTLTRIASAGLQADAALPEYLMLPIEDGTWSLLQHEEGTLLRAARGFGLAMDQGQPPAGLRLALDRASDLGLPLPRRLCLFQGNAVQAADPAAWSQACGIKVETRGQWNWRDPTWPEFANLLSGQFVSRHGRFNARSLLQPLVAGAVLLAAIHVSGTAFDWLRLSREEHNLIAEMQQAASSVLPPGARIVDPSWQVAETLKSLQGMQNDAGARMLSLMTVAGKGRPPGGMAELRAVRYEMERLSLDYARTDPDWIDRYVARLTAQGLHAGREPGAEGGAQRIVIASRPPAGNGDNYAR